MGKKWNFGAGENIKWCSHCGNQFGSFSKCKADMTQQFHFWKDKQKN
jgi:hypothetical protein